MEQEIEEIVNSCGVNLYDIETLKENDRLIFRVYITHKDGIDIDKCVEVSNMLSPYLDVNEPLSKEYNLEVSSPGIERKLTKLKHFKYSIGSDVRIKDTNLEEIIGKIVDVKDDTILIKTNYDIEEIKFDDILSAKTFFKF